MHIFQMGSDDAFQLNPNRIGAVGAQSALLGTYCIHIMRNNDEKLNACNVQEAISFAQK